MDANGLVVLPKMHSHLKDMAFQTLFPTHDVKLRTQDGSNANTRANYLRASASVGCDGMTLMKVLNIFVRANCLILTGLTMGYHLAKIHESWSSRPWKARLQLEQVGLSQDDCNEAQEYLMQLTEKYTNTS